MRGDPNRQRLVFLNCAYEYLPEIENIIERRNEQTKERKSSCEPFFSEDREEARSGQDHSKVSSAGSEERCLRQHHRRFIRRTAKLRFLARVRRPHG